MATVRTEFPYKVRQVDYQPIELSDGVRLVARLWLPETDTAVPAILEAIPYRLADGMAARDAGIHPYFAGHGYAAVRLDLRGSGESGGILTDEYAAQEQKDLLEVIAWIAAQPWCDGNVGMTGISWGGFNSLQLAALRPPALRAIITLMSTDDRYADDVHYKGGCVLATDLLHWSSCMLHWQCQPPHEAAVGEHWREMWLERLEASQPWVHHWLAHQRRDAYWKHGSVCEDYDAIEVPVYAIGGWIDGYTNSVLRLLAGLKGPRKGLIGPWPHAFPHDAVPGPEVGYLQEALRWWDRWLKGERNGIDDEPMFRVWMQDYLPPAPLVEQQPGRWVAEERWPSPLIETRHWRLDADGVLRQRGAGTGGAASGPEAAAGAPGPDAEAAAANGADAEGRLRILGSQLCGVEAGSWCAEGQVSDWAPDQRAAEGQSLTWTSAPLTERVEILGHPRAVLRMTSDRPLALAAVRLDDVRADGVSRVVSQQVFNLTHRESHEHPERLEPGREYEVAIDLDAIAQAFPAGHRLRLAVSPTYWPWAWPSPRDRDADHRLRRQRPRLPVRPPRASDEDLPAFAPPEVPPGLATASEGGTPVGRSCVRDFSAETVTWSFKYYDGSVFTLPNGWATQEWNQVNYAIREGDPLSARTWVDAEASSIAGPRDASGSSRAARWTRTRRTTACATG